MSYTTLDSFIETHAADFIGRLSALCRVPSIAAEGGAPMAEAADQVAALCRWAGVRAELAPTGGAPVVLGQAGAGKRGLLIYNHYDVQPPDPLEAWVSPPFEPVVRDGALYARGVADNKANLVARLAAAWAYRQVYGDLPLRLVFVLEGEEEISSPHLAAFAAAHAGLLRTLDGCIWEAGYKDEADRPEVSLGLKGILTVELRARTANSDAHSGNGGLYPNAVWRLVEALSTLRAPDGRVTVDGFDDAIRPPTPAEEAMLAAIPFDAAAIRRAYGMAEFLGGLEGVAALRRLMFEPTCTINGIWGGYSGPGAKTVIPCQATAKLDFRLVPDQTPADALRLLRDHLARRGFTDIVAVDIEDGLMPARTHPGAAIVRAVIAAVSDVHGAAPVVQPCVGGSGPMYQLCQAYGIPAVSIGVGWAGSRVHAPNESVRLADFVEGIKVMARVYRLFAGTEA